MVKARIKRIIDEALLAAEFEEARSHGFRHLPCMGRDITQLIFGAKHLFYVFDPLGNITQLDITYIPYI